MEVAPILVNPGQTNKANKIFGCHRLGRLEATRVKDVKGKVATQLHRESGGISWNLRYGQMAAGSQAPFAQGKEGKDGRSKGSKSDIEPSRSLIWTSDLAGKGSSKGKANGKANGSSNEHWGNTTGEELCSSLDVSTTYSNSYFVAKCFEMLREGGAFGLWCDVSSSKQLCEESTQTGWLMHDEKQLNHSCNSWCRFYYFILAWFMTLKGTVQLHID